MAGTTSRGTGMSLDPRNRAGHEASGTVAPFAFASTKRIGCINEGAVASTAGEAAGVGRGEADSTVLVNVDGLATGDTDILRFMSILMSLNWTHLIVATGGFLGRDSVYIPERLLRKGWCRWSTCYKELRHCRGSRSWSFHRARTCHRQRSGTKSELGNHCEGQ